MRYCVLSVDYLHIISHSDECEIIQSVLACRCRTTFLKTKQQQLHCDICLYIKKLCNAVKQNSPCYSKWISEKESVLNITLDFVFICAIHVHTLLVYTYMVKFKFPKQLGARKMKTLNIVWKLFEQTDCQVLVCTNLFSIWLRMKLYSLYNRLRICPVTNQ